MFIIKNSSGGHLGGLDPDETMEFTEDDLHEIGRFFIRVVQEEADEDRMRIGQLPDSDTVNRSFTYTIDGDSIHFHSDWEWIDRYVEGRSPYPMTWLTRERGAYRVPLVQKDGSVIVRMAPLTIGDSWIHPGVAKHTFVQRALERTGDFALEILWNKLADAFDD